MMSKSPIFNKELDLESNEGTLRSIEQILEDQRHSLGGPYDRFASKSELKGAFDFKNRMNNALGGIGLQDSDSSRVMPIKHK